MKAIDESDASGLKAPQAPVAPFEHGATVFAIPTRGGVPLPAYDVIWPDKRIFAVFGAATPGPAGLQLQDATRAVLPQLVGLTETNEFTVVFCPSHENFVATFAKIRAEAEDGAHLLMLLPDFDVAGAIIEQLGVRRPPSLAIH